MRYGVIVWFLFICSFSIDANEAPFYEIRDALQTHNYEMLQRLVGEYGKKIQLKRIEELAIEAQDLPLMRSIQAVRAIEGMKVKTALTRSELLQMALFIETKLASFVRKGKYYLPHYHTELARSIEYDPKTNLTFIHLGTKGIDRVGRGTKKTVTKSILYSPTAPDIVARCKQERSIPEEWVITKHLENTPGVIQALAFTSHMERGIPYHTIFCKLYEPGPISNILKGKSQQFSLKDRIKIAFDIVRGLEGMQQKNVVHRDFCGQNCLVHVSKSAKGKRMVEAVIADFGCSGFATEAKGSRVQGHSAYTAPEGIFRDKLNGEDYFKTDLFAAGSLMYCLSIDVAPKWLDQTLTTGTKNARYRYRRHVGFIEKAISKRKRIILQKQQKGGSLSLKDEYESVILQMIDPNPTKRGSAHEHRVRLEELYKRAS
jgi:serine/threonine protein kinase